MADNMNLFKVHNDTEKLFIQRELEREFKDIQRFEKMNLRVHQKTTSTCINRAGTLRMLNDIPALRPEKRRNQSTKNFASQDVGGGGPTDETNKPKFGQKMNIFNQENSAMVRAAIQGGSDQG